MGSRPNKKFIPENGELQMITNKGIGLLLALAAVVSMLTTSLFAGTPSMRLLGKNRVGASEIKASYETKGTRAKFSTELTRVATNSTFTIVAARGTQALGTWTVRTNAVGFADLNRDTSNGQQVPQLVAGDVVSVSFGTVVTRVLLQVR